MTNLVISTACNQACVYCFTRDHNGDGHGDSAYLDAEHFQSRLDFLKRSGIEQARFLGGEPTLHPRFEQLVQQALEQSFQVMVFTNGLMPESALACLARLPVEGCDVLVNVNAPAHAGPAVYERQRATLRRLGARAMPGLNIYRPDLDLDFVLALVAETLCKPSVRLGLAHPCLSGNNQYLHPKQYRFVAHKIVGMARRAAEQGVKVEFDCGFVRCMFSDAELEELKGWDADVGWRCNPILDIDLAGQAIHCFPLSKLGTLQLTAESNAQDMGRIFETWTAPYRQAGVFKECSGCSFKVSGDCPGGCLAVTLRRFRHTPFTLHVPGSQPEIGR